MKKLSGAQRQARGIQHDAWIPYETNPDFSQYSGDERNRHLIAHDTRHSDLMIGIILFIAVLAAIVTIIHLIISGI